MTGKRVGFIGTGEIAHLHARAMERLGSRWTVAGGCDLLPEAARAFVGRYGGAVYPAPEDLLGDPAVEAVYICTRHDSHVKLAAAACRAGKQVLLEKPLAMYPSEAGELRAVARRHPTVLAVGYNMRVAPATLRFRRLLEQHGVQPESFRASMTGAPFMNGWAADPKSGGGVLVCQGSHMFDLLAHLLGSRVAAVCCVTQHLSQPAELLPNAASLLVRMENGLCGTLLLHDRGSYPFHVEPGGHMVNITLYAPQGTFELDAYGSIRYGAETRCEEELPSSSPAMEERWGYQNQAEAFLRLTERGESPLCTLEQAAQTVEAVEAARRSAREGRWVEVPAIPPE